MLFYITNGSRSSFYRLFFWSRFSVGLLLFLLSFSAWSPIIIASFGCVWFVTALTPHPVFPESFLARPTPLCVFHYLVFPVCSLPAALQAPVERRMKLTESRQNSRTVNSGSLCRAWIPSHSWGWNLCLSSLQNSILDFFFYLKKRKTRATVKKRFKKILSGN